MDGRCRIEMLGGLRVVQGERVIRRFRTQKTGSLLAYLACHLAADHPREVLADLLWPEAEPDAGRQSLRTSLAALRRQLEPPGVRTGTVLVATRFSVRLNLAGVTTDVSDLANALRSADRAEDDVERACWLADAADRYHSELLPGWYDDWVLAEQQRLAGQIAIALHELVEGLMRIGQFERAIPYARRAVEGEELREEAHCDLIRVYMAAGKPGAARAQYGELERLLWEQLRQEPLPETRRLLKQADIGNPPRARDPVRLRVPASVTGLLHEPSWASAPARHLPVQVTRFFGRERQITELRELLDPSHLESRTSRLVTLTGPGGSGKTRLAIEVAGVLLEAYGGATWFVPLDGLADAGLIAGAVVRALGLSGDPSIDPLEQAAQSLAFRPSLLVLDSAEHLLGGAGRESIVESTDGALVVRSLLERTAGLACLVTSRRLLGVSGEREIPVPPLVVPEAPDATPETLGDCESVRLFVDRAQAARPDFQLTSRNARAVAELCGRLEGIPLALELAAARASVLTPAQMLEQMSDRFGWLVSRRRDVTDRHRTLHAAVDRSFQVLPPELQRLFCRLSVFRGGWRADAAEAVCEEPRALERLERLRECSLVLAEDRDGVIRFRMLETLREFGWEQLTPEERTRLQERHAEWCIALAERADVRGALRSPAFGAALDILESEHDNIRAAQAWLLGPRGDVAACDRLIWLLSIFWGARGHQHEGLHWAEAVLKRDQRWNPDLRADVLASTAHLAWASGEYPTAWRLAEDALKLFRELEDQSGVARALRMLGRLAMLWHADYALARLLYEEALELARSATDTEGTMDTLVSMSFLADVQGDAGWAALLYAERAALQGGSERTGLEERLGQAQASGDKPGAAKCLDELADRARERGAYAECRSLLEQSLPLLREIGSKRELSNALNDLGVIALRTREYEAAAAPLHEALQGYRELGDKRLISLPLGHLGDLAFRQGDLDEARCLLGQSLALCREIGFQEGTLRRLRSLAQIACQMGAHDEARRHVVECLQIARRARQAEWAALALEPCADHAMGTGDPERAARLLACAEAMRQLLDRPLPPCEAPDREHLVAALHATLGGGALAAAQAEGRAMGWEQAVAYALGEPDR